MRKISFALFAVAVIAAAALLAFNSGGPATAAAGGPVILGGDDLTDHGSVDDTTVPPTVFDGWLYIQKALENLKPNVARPGNDGSVAVLGSVDSTETSGDAGAAYHFAAPDIAGTVKLKKLDGGRWLITRGVAEFHRESISTTGRPECAPAPSTGPRTRRC